MDFDETPEESAFRAECRAFLSQHGKPKVAGSTQVTMSTLAEDELVHVKECRDWQRVKADAGWAGLTWPAEYGGRGLTGLHEGIFAEAKAIHQGGGNGSIIGRNTFQRPRDKALELLGKLTEIYLGKA